MWRLQSSSGSNLVVRLPLTTNGIEGLRREIELLPLLATTPVVELVDIPTVVESGADGAGRPWVVLDWLDGDDAWAARDTTDENATGLASAMANVVKAIGACGGLPAPERSAGARGGPIAPLLDRLDDWLSSPTWSASSLLDVAAVRRVAARCAEAAGDPVAQSFVHGDLIAGNLLVRDGALSAVIDWGGAGHGDPAQDLAPAWSMFDGSARAAFRRAMDVDEAAWLRATAFELEHAVGGVLYYVPRGHLLGDIMQRTLDRLLDAWVP